MADAAPRRVPWRFEQRLVVEHLGAWKYSRGLTALRELVANAFDARATRVDLAFDYNQLGEKLGELDKVTIDDNGRGMTLAEVEERFSLAGATLPDEIHDAYLGRFGVGRFAVFRVGTTSIWRTVTANNRGGTCTVLRLSEEVPEGFDIVEHRRALPSERAGTTVTISGLKDTGNDSLHPARVAADLVSHYCSFLLANPDRAIVVEGERLDVASMVQRRQREEIAPTAQVPDGATIDHLLLTSNIDDARFPHRVLLTAKGRAVDRIDLELLPARNYLGLVECPYLDRLVTSSREALVEMDGVVAHLKQAVEQRVVAFGESLREQRRKSFIESARKKDFYPFRDGIGGDPVRTVEQEFYDVVLGTVNEHVNLDGMSKRQQAVVFGLLRRVIADENLLPVLQEMLGLKPDEVEKFRQVLEHTTLSSIIKLSSVVTERRAFLDFLQEVVYGEPRKHVKERAHLHKFVERHGWLFGPQYYLATSDKSFRQVIRRHRAMAGLPSLDDEAIARVAGINDIPDLFFASRSIQHGASRHRQDLIVEIKAPLVVVGTKELDQIRRYAKTIRDSSEFDKKVTHWDLFLVSGDVSPEIDDNRNESNRPRGCVGQWDDMSIWVWKWGELIEKAKDDMRLVQSNLDIRREGTNVAEYLRLNFPDIFVDGLSSSPSTDGPETVSDPS